MTSENMTVDQFIEEQHERLDTFALWWKAQQVKEGVDSFPFQMRPGEWGEVFHFFDID